MVNAAANTLSNMVNAEPKKPWQPGQIGMLGERRAKEILKKSPQSLSLAQWQALKKVFKKKVPLTTRHLSEAYARHERLSDLCTKFTDQEKRWLLAVLVPADLKAEMIVQENWDECAAFTINDVFRNRFEYTPIQTLRRFVDGEIDFLDGMVLAEDRIRIHQEGIDTAMKALSTARQSARSRLYRLKKMNSEMKKVRIAKLDGGRSMIEDSIYRVLCRKSSTHFNDGTSTYAEPTAKGWKSIAEALSMKPMTKEDIILDLGSGTAATLWQLCQYHNCKGIGIEYGVARMRLAAKGAADLLNKLGDHPNFNPQVVNTQGDILNLTALPPCSVLYIYDEAFNDELMDHILWLIENAPPRLRYIISFKANRFPVYRNIWNDCLGCRAVSLGNKVYKTFSSEGSRFDLYERNVPANDKVPNATHNGVYEEYWNSSIEAKKNYYNRLYDSMNECLNKETQERKVAAKKKTTTTKNVAAKKKTTTKKAKKQ